MLNNLNTITKDYILIIDGAILQEKKNQSEDWFFQLYSKGGGRGRSRTCDRLVRSQVLYPAELRAHSKPFLISCSKIISINFISLDICLFHNSIKKNGGRGRSRTCDRLVRSQVLYPAELRALT